MAETKSQDAIALLKEDHRDGREAVRGIRKSEGRWPQAEAGAANLPRARSTR